MEIRNRFEMLRAVSVFNSKSSRIKALQGPIFHAECITQHCTGNTSTTYLHNINVELSVQLQHNDGCLLIEPCTPMHLLIIRFNVLAIYWIVEECRMTKRFFYWIFEAKRRIESFVYSMKILTKYQAALKMSSWLIVVLCSMD